MRLYFGTGISKRYEYIRFLPMTLCLPREELNFLKCTTRPTHVYVCVCDELSKT